MEQIRVIKEMRERDRSDGRTDTDVFPRFMVWENVFGCFSSHGGEDFRAVLEETARVAEPDAVIPRYEGGRWTNAGSIIGNGFSLAWRTIDSQYWGTPQRRRRVALVADFDGLLAPEILFERGAGGASGSEVYAVSEGVSGDHQSGGPEGKETAGGLEGGTGKTGESLCFRNHYDGRVLKETSLCLDTCRGGTDNPAFLKNECYGFPLGFRPENVRVYEETSTTLCNGTRPGFTTGVIDERDSQI